MDRFKTEYVTKEWEEQLKFADDNPNIKFAVPPEGENVETVNVVDEIRDEIFEFLESQIHMLEGWIKIENSLESNKELRRLNLALKGIKNIFEKYSK